MRKYILFVFSAIFVFSLSGCRPSTPKVAVTSYPVQYLVEQIGQEYVDVENVSQEGVMQRAKIVDDYEDILKDCDVLFYINSLEPYMEMYLDDFRSSRVDMVDLSAISAINQFKRYTTVFVDNKNVVAETAWYDGDVFQNIDLYDKDPVLWIDPISMSSMGNTVCDYLSEQFPEYAKAFQQNFEQLENELARLDADYQSLRSEGKNIAFVSMTASFGNWQKSYGVKVYPIVLSRYGALPNDAQLEIIKQRIQNDGVRYIAKEPNLPADMQELQDQLANDLGLISVELSNISSLSQEQKDSGLDYKSIMYQNLKVLDELSD